MAKIDYRVIYAGIAKSPAGQKQIETRVQNKFDANKEEFLEEFENDPITEAMQGATTDTTDQLHGYGNLRAFFGFTEGKDVVTPVKEVLEKDLVLANPRKVKAKEKSVVMTFSVKIPEQAIKDASKLEFEPGNSWVYAVENGLSGFSHFLFKKFKSPQPSRSGEGIQTENELRVKSNTLPGDFVPKPYLSQMIDNLISRLKRK